MNDHSLELDIDAENELLFRINVEGSSGNAKVRLICESNGMSYMFKGSPVNEPDIVRFIIPKMGNFLEEDVRLTSKIEVVIDDRVFEPMKFDIRFKRPVKVFAESIENRQTQCEIRVSANVAGPRSLAERYTKRKTRV